MVRPLQTRSGGCRRIEWQDLLLTANVDLLAPIGLAARVFETSAIVAAEMRRLDHFDGELVALRQSKEPACKPEHVGDELCGNAVAGQIEEAETSRRITKLAQERISLLWLSFKPAQIEDR